MSDIASNTPAKIAVIFLCHHRIKLNKTDLFVYTSHRILNHLNKSSAMCVTS